MGQHNRFIPPKKNPQRHALRGFLPFAAILVIAGIPACSTGGDPVLPSEPDDFPSNADAGPGPENYDWDSVQAPQLAEDVVELDELSCFDRLEVSEDFTETVIHLFCPASAVDIEAGDLLVSSAGSGYLLRTLTVSDGDYAILAETTPGTLTELFPDGGFFETFVLEDEGRDALSWGATTLYSEDGLILRFEGATIDMDTPKIHFGTEHSGGDVLRRDLYLEMDSSISLDVSATAQASISRTETKELFSKSFPIRLVTPTITYVGEVVLTAKVKLTANMKAGASLRTGTTLDTTLRVGTTYNEIEDRFEDLENIEATFTAHEPEITTRREMSLRASIDFRAEVKHYKIISTYVETGPYLKFTGTAECSELDWDLKAGWGGKFGAHADVFFWDVNIVTIPFDVPFGGPIAEGVFELPVSVGGEDCDDPVSCQVVQELSCGQIVSGNTGTDPLATLAIDAYDINVGNYSAPELVYRWSGGAAEFKFVEPEPTAVNHDIMIIEARGEGESCSENAGLDWGLNEVEWEGGGPVFVVIDGYNHSQGAFQLEVDCGA